MVFCVPGGGGDAGGDDYWDRNEEDGKWDGASDEQKERMKRVLAARKRLEDHELFDQKTGEKLTFNFPEIPPAAASLGRRGGKRNNKLDKSEERGEKEKGQDQSNRLSDRGEDEELFDKPGVVGDEDEGGARDDESEKQRQEEVVSKDKKVSLTFSDLQAGCGPASTSLGKERGRGKRRKEIWVFKRGSEGTNNDQKSVTAENKTEGKDVLIVGAGNGNKAKGKMEKNPYMDEPKVEMEKNPDMDKPKGEKEKNPDMDEPKGEKEKNLSVNFIEFSYEGEVRIKDKENVPKGEKQKNESEVIEDEEENDLFDENIEEGVVIHMHPIKKDVNSPVNKCQYEIIREKNIAERDAQMREVLAEIQKESREIIKDYEKKRKNVNNHVKGGQIKKRKVEKVVDMGGERRSAWERKPVDYCAIDYSDDPDWEPEAKKKDRRKRKIRDRSNDHIKDRKQLPKGWNPKYNHIHNPFERKRKREDDEPADKTPLSSAASSMRSKRPRKSVRYNLYEPREDEFVFCERCNEPKYHGCEIHPLIFDYVARFDVGPSKVGKNAGRGIFNNDPRGDIPEGVMFGPYDGIFYTCEEYELLKKTRGESGYAWELKDPDKIKVIGFVDPGPNPDPELQWMSIVNCASKTRTQNLMPGQFFGGIYYRSIDVIRYGEELLTYYGDDYADTINIKVAERDFYELDEDWEEEGVLCPHCGDGFVKEEFLQNHIDKVDSTKNGGCRALRNERNRADVLAGVKPYVCEQCGKGFKTASALKRHKDTHNEARSFVCQDCGNSFKYNNALTAHIKRMHEEHPTFDCPDCERPFKQKSHMLTHWKNICNREDKEFKCTQCGKKFNQKGNMMSHIKAVHNRELPHKCDICGKRFASKGDLNQHIRWMHDDSRPFECEDCDATYKTAVNLDHHRIRTHTKQWYWNCEECDKEGIEKGFLVPSHLKLHMLANHPLEYRKQIERENPAVCPKCQKRFPSEEQVVIHIKKMHS